VVPKIFVKMMMLSLHERFVNAEKIFQECKDRVPENLTMKLYGLSKQAKEGDCRMPMPPR
jgi:acyl-CoA-binding protein